MSLVTNHETLERARFLQPSAAGSSGGSLWQKQDSVTSAVDRFLGVSDIHLGTY